MKIIKILMPLLLLSGINANAQKAKEVHGTYQYLVDEKANLTFEDARTRAIENARSEAIKEVFGSYVSSDIVVNTISDSNGDSRTVLQELSREVAKGDWLGDIEQPIVTIAYDNDLHTFIYNVEVKGQAREIKQSKTELDWRILRGNTEDKSESDVFNNKERFFISFKTPSAGYVAIYLLTSDDEASCLLPYRKNTDGRYKVDSNKRLVFFDPQSDPDAVNYRLSTNQAVENDVIYFIYSPNAFTKCNDLNNDPRRPNTLNVEDFNKWLLRSQLRDKDMVVERKWVKILNREKE